MTNTDIQRLLVFLRDNERRVIEARYIHGKTLKETGKELGISKTRVTEIEKRGVSKIRRQLRKEAVILPLTAKGKA